MTGSAEESNNFPVIFRFKLKGEKRIRAAGGNFFNILYVWIPKVKIERVVAETDRGGFVRGVLRLSLE